MASPNAAMMLSDEDMGIGANGILSDADMGIPVPQIKGAVRIPALIGSNAAEGTASVAAIPGALGGLMEKGLDKVAPGGAAQDPAMIALAKHLGLPDASASSFLGAPMIHRIGQMTGLWDRPDLQPQDTFERDIAATARGAGSALPAIATGGASVIPALVSGAGAGLGSQVGEDIAPEHPIIGSLVGGTLGGISPIGFTNAIGKAANAVRGIGNDMTDAYATAGITPRLAGDVTQSPVLQGMQAFSAKTPMGAGRIADAANKTAAEFGDSAERVASSLGASETPQDVGTALQGATAKWMTNFKAQNATNWGALDGMFPAGVKVGNYQKALASVADSLPQAQATAQVLQPSLTANLKVALAKDLGDASGNPITDSLPWQSVKGIRTLIGEKLEDPNLPADASTADLKRLYKGLTQDMQTAAQSAGPQAQAAFQSANDYTKSGHQFIDMMRPMIKQGQTPEGAASLVLPKLNSGGTMINTIRAQIPDAADEIAAYKVRDMASAVSGRQNAAGNAVSPSSFLTDWNKLAPEAKQALYDPQQETQLGALAKVSEGIKGTLSKINTSNTAAHGDWKSLFGLPGRLAAGAFGGHEIGGHTGMLAGMAAAAAPEAGGYFGGRLTATPALTSYFAAPGLIDPTSGRLATGLGTYASMFPQVSPRPQIGQ